MALRCFVAMALGREDTDKVYDDLIVPALREKGVTPVRVDRIEHNEDIDDRIIRELELCDFALGDLTYARPSVYFEAGFAQRKVPVIYTCRRDHLKAKADDPYGNLRVHFDLQMKNIIAWSSPSDRGFQKRLGKRVGVVIRPLLRDREAQDELMRQVESFSALSVEERIQRVLNICIRRLRGARYRGIVVHAEAVREHFGIATSLAAIEGWDRGFPDDFHRRLFDTAVALEPGWIGMRRASGVICGALVHVALHLHGRHLGLLRARVLNHPIHDVNLGYRGGPGDLLVEHVYLCSLSKVPRARAEDAFRDFRWDEDMEAYARTDVLQLPRAGSVAQHAKVFVGPGSERVVVLNPRAKLSERRRVTYWRRNDTFARWHQPGLGRAHDVQRRVYVHLLDEIKSDEAFEARFSACVKRTTRPLCETNK